ncbi:MAG: hypothetical protein V4507_08130, partial [Verrucomicrobiota bacterium]
SKLLKLPLLHWKKTKNNNEFLLAMNLG